MRKHPHPLVPSITGHLIIPPEAGSLTSTYRVVRKYNFLPLREKKVESETGAGVCLIFGLVSFGTEFQLSQVSLVSFRLSRWVEMKRK